MNRGIARRTMFEHRGDVRTFLYEMARSVREHLLEVHAFTIMGTHFHLLLRSPIGKLSKAMHRIQLNYSRYFNRGRKRDGSLVRGRYKSTPVESIHYRRALVAYIDFNPVCAGLAAEMGEYPFGSAYYYTRSATKPPWLERRWIESEACSASSVDSYNPDLYGQVFPTLLDPRILRLVQSRIKAKSAKDPLDYLLIGGPTDVKDWMQRKARLADGADPGLAVCDSDTVDEIVARSSLDQPHFLKPSKRNDWQIIRVGLLYELCGLTQQAISNKIGCSETVVGRRVGHFRNLINTNQVFADLVSKLTREALKDWASVGG